MALFTLSDIALAKSKGSIYLSSHSPVPPKTQQQLNLLIQQKRLGLPIEEILEVNPLLSNWIKQLEDCFPALFNPRKKLYLNVPITAELILPSQEKHYLEVPVNVGQGKG